jgi:hypothetical protein
VTYHMKNTFQQNMQCSLTTLHGMSGFPFSRMKKHMQISNILGDLFRIKRVDIYPVGILLWWGETQYCPQNILW